MLQCCGGAQTPPQQFFFPGFSLPLDGDFVQTHISVQNTGVNVEGETAPDAVQEGNGADTDGNGNGQNGEQINE